MLLFSLWFFLLGFITPANASPFGISYSQVIVGQDPDHMKGMRAAVTYQPECLIWQYVQIYFDTSYGHWWVSGSQHHSLNSFSVAPYLRYWLARRPIFSPFVEISIAPAYVSRTRLGEANLGMHFIFQDQVSIGSAFGPQRKFYTLLSLIHYSNGSFCEHNQGMTAPVTLTFGYRF